VELCLLLLVVLDHLQVLEEEVLASYQTLVIS
jgi:hypothetical protein